MKLTFFGAAGEVTGSCTLLETGRARVLIDFGLHQGGPQAEKRNRRLPAVPWSRLDAVVLTHAHIDHCGRLPLLERAGFTGPVHATPASVELADIMLRDSASVQQADAERESRRRARAGRAPEQPLYTEDDVSRLMPRFVPTPYATPREVAPGVGLTFRDAGHIIGSAIVELRVRDGAGERTLVFSGDLGPRGAPLLRDPYRPTQADLVVLESTYGDRDHRPREQTMDELAGILRGARTPRGKVIIPAFAVGRTQSLIFHLGQLRRAGRLDGVPVVIDSPMAIEATTLYRRHRELFDDEAWALIQNGDSPLHFPELRFSRTAEESRALNDQGGGIVIIAASGMANAGRVLHHLRHALWRPETRVVIVGFQSAGSLGRRLVDGQKRVNIMGEAVAVKASIHTLGGLSAHAGRTELLEWAAGFDASRPRFVLNHGENRPRRALAEELLRRGARSVDLPEFGSPVEF